MGLRIVEASATPTISAATYASGQALGGIVSFITPGMADRMVLQKVIIIDKSNQKAAIDCLLFKASFSPTADKSNINISAADAANMCGVVSVTAGDYSTISTASNGLAIATHTFAGGGLGILSADALNKIYCQLVSRGTPIYNTTSDISVTLDLQVWIE